MIAIFLDVFYVILALIALYVVFTLAIGIVVVIKGVIEQWNKP